MRNSFVFVFLAFIFAFTRAQGAAGLRGGSSTLTGQGVSAYLSFPSSAVTSGSGLSIMTVGGVANGVQSSAHGQAQISFQGIVSSTCSLYAPGAVGLWRTDLNAWVSANALFEPNSQSGNVVFTAVVPSDLVASGQIQVRLVTGALASCSTTVSNVVVTVNQPLVY